MSYDDIQRYDLARGEELNNSRSTSLSTKKFSMYTGLSPKEKIEYHDYSDLRDQGPRLSVEARQPRRFSRPQPEQGDSGLPSLELTWASQGELVTSPRKRQMSESMTTPRYMDWYIKQQHEQHEQLRQRQLDLQQQQEATRQRIKIKQRQPAQVWNDIK